MSMSPFAPVAFLYLLLLLIVFSTPVMLQEDAQTNCPTCECEDVHPNADGPSLLVTCLNAELSFFTSSCRGTAEADLS